MNQESVLIRCDDCGTKNRVPKERLKESPKCGKCRSILQPETLFIKCSNCGAKNRIFKAQLQDKPRCGKCHETLQTIFVFDYVVETNDRTFNYEVLFFPGPVLMEFYSNSCGYCHMQASILQQLASEYAGLLKITKLNIELNPVTASRYQVMSTPAMILFKEGKEVDKMLGLQQKHEIENRLRPFLDG